MHLKQQVPFIDYPPTNTLSLNVLYKIPDMKNCNKNIYDHKILSFTTQSSNKFGISLHSYTKWFQEITFFFCTNSSPTITCFTTDKPYQPYTNDASNSTNIILLVNYLSTFLNHSFRELYAAPYYIVCVCLSSKIIDFLLLCGNSSKKSINKTTL